MDGRGYDRVVTVQRAALGEEVAALVAMLAVAVVTRGLRLSALAILRAAESAARRLIVILARDMATARGPRPPARGKSAPARGRMRGAPGHGNALPPVFPLFDPRPNPKPSEPPKAEGYGPQFGRIGVDAFHHPAKPPAPSPDDPVDATALRRRIEALLLAMADLEGCAARLARRLKGGRCKFVHAIRRGRPPGWRKRGTHRIDVILADCHHFAERVIAGFDTS